MLDRSRCFRLGVDRVQAEQRISSCWLDREVLARVKESRLYREETIVTGLTWGVFNDDQFRYGKHRIIHFFVQNL